MKITLPVGVGAGTCTIGRVYTNSCYTNLPTLVILFLMFDTVESTDVLPVWRREKYNVICYYSIWYKHTSISVEMDPSLV